MTTFTRKREGYTDNEEIVESLSGLVQGKPQDIILIGTVIGSLHWTDAECQLVWQQISALSFSACTHQPERGPVLCCMPVFVKVRHEPDDVWFRGGVMFLRSTEETSHENRIPLQAVNLSEILETWELKRNEL